MWHISAQKQSTCAPFFQIRQIFQATFLDFLDDQIRKQHAAAVNGIPAKALISKKFG